MSGGGITARLALDRLGRIRVWLERLAVAVGLVFVGYALRRVVTSTSRPG